MKGAWRGLVGLGAVAGVACGAARDASPSSGSAGGGAASAPVAATPPASAPPPGPWMTATPAGALRVTTPARWACEAGVAGAPLRRAFRPGMRTSCLVPAEFLTHQVFGCPDRVTRGGEEHRATYDARERLVAFGPRPDYQVTYTWDDQDRVTARNGTPVTVTREPAAIVVVEDGVPLRVTLDAQQRPVGVGDLVRIDLTWSGDDLVRTRWAMSGLPPEEVAYAPCGATAPALAEEPAGAP